MNGKLKEMVDKGGAVAGWVKVASIIGAGVVACVLIWNQVGTNTADIEQLNRYQKNHYGLIQELDKNQIKTDGRINVLEIDSKRKDEMNQKMMDTLNALNVSIEKLNTTVEMIQKQNQK